jgi:membrane associated rhomboid family serine protease
MKIVSYVILAILFIVYFTSLNNYNTSNEFINYHLRAFYHANLSHLIANAISLYALSFMENVIGSARFLFAIIFIWIFGSIILYLIHKMFPSRKRYTLGFSGVIFGLFVIYYTLLNQGPGVTFAGLIISILPQIMIPGISFEGHLAGIFAGILYVILFPVHERIGKGQGMFSN